MYPHSNLRIGQQPRRRGSGKQYLKRKEVPCGRGEIGGDGFSEIHMMKMKLDEEDRRKEERRKRQQNNNNGMVMMMGQQDVVSKENSTPSGRKKRSTKGDEDENEVVIMPIVNLAGGWEGLGPLPPPVVRKPNTREE